MDVLVLSKIKLIAIDRILPFEWTGPDCCENENSDAPAEFRLIRHPFPVLNLHDGNYLLLEETDRFRALTETDLDVLPVQVCSADSLKIKTDRLGLVNFHYDDLVRLAGKAPAQIVITENGAEPPKGSTHVEAVFAFDGRPPLSVWLRHSSRAGCPAPLTQIFRQIISQGRYVPITHQTIRPDALTRSVSVSATVSLPELELGDLKSAAVADRLFPPGVVRVVPNCRVLNIDLPVSVLKSEAPVEEKESFVLELIALREQSRRTSFYEGQVYLLNR